MAESQSGFDMTEYEYELDKGLENVMPDDWDGHQRIRNWEMFMG